MVRDDPNGPKKQAANQVPQFRREDLSWRSDDRNGPDKSAEGKFSKTYLTGRHVHLDVISWYLSDSKCNDNLATCMTGHLMGFTDDRTISKQKCFSRFDECGEISGRSALASFVSIMIC